MNIPSLQELISFYEKYFPNSDGTVISEDPFKKSADLVDLKPYSVRRRTSSSLDMKHDLVMLGWHDCEDHHGVEVRWSGPGNDASIMFRLNGMSKVSFGLVFAAGLNNDDLSVAINDMPVAVEKVVIGNQCVIDFQEFPPKGELAEIRFKLERMARVFPDQRQLGICVSSFVAGFE